MYPSPFPFYVIDQVSKGDYGLFRFPQLPQPCPIYVYKLIIHVYFSTLSCVSQEIFSLTNLIFLLNAGFRSCPFINPLFPPAARRDCSGHLFLSVSLISVHCGQPGGYRNLLSDDIRILLYKIIGNGRTQYCQENRSQYPHIAYYIREAVYHSHRNDDAQS